MVFVARKFRRHFFREDDDSQGVGIFKWGELERLALFVSGHEIHWVTVLILNTDADDSERFTQRAAAFSTHHDNGVAFLAIELRCGLLHAFCLACNSNAERGVDSRRLQLRTG